jgi:dTDP-4-amino-4,6-dideoxygalactose transaminase
LRKHLTQAGIPTVLNYPKALPFYPAYAYLGHRPEDFPSAYAHQSRILSLPIYPEVTDEVIKDVVCQIKDAVEPSRRPGTSDRVEQADLVLNTTG